MRDLMIEDCPPQHCRTSEFFDNGYCLCVACNSCGSRAPADRLDCETECRDYLQSKNTESNVARTISIQPMTSSPVSDVSTNLGRPDHQQQPIWILIAIIGILLLLICLVFFSWCFIKHSKRKLSKPKEKDVEAAVVTTQKTEFETEIETMERVHEKISTDINKATTVATQAVNNQNEKRETDLRDTDQLSNQSGGSNFQPEVCSDSVKCTEAVIECAGNKYDSKTMEESVLGKKEESLPADCGVNDTDSSRDDHESSTAGSHLEKLENSKYQNSYVISQALETMTNIKLRHTHQEAVAKVENAIVHIPQKEENAVLDDSVTCIKAIHGQPEEETPLLEGTEQYGVGPDLEKPVYSIKSVKDMPARSNKSLYPILRGIPWVIGYFSQGNSIEVYVDFNDISPEEALNQLTRQTGTSPKKYHVKENEFYP